MSALRVHVMTTHAFSKPTPIPASAANSRTATGIDMADLLEREFASRAQRLEQTATSASALCQRLTPAPADDGVPAVCWRPSANLVEDCQAAARELASAMARYVRRVAQLAEKPVMLAPMSVDGRLVVTLSAAARMTKQERTATAHTVMPDQGEFKTMLDRRSHRGARVLASQSYMVRYADGRYALHVLRGVIPECLSHGHLVVQTVHLYCSSGWYLGCGADQPQCVLKDVHMLRTVRGAAALRLVEGFRVLDMKHRGGITQQRLLIDYADRQGKLHQGFGGCWPDPIPLPTHPSLVCSGSCHSHSHFHSHRHSHRHRHRSPSPSPLTITVTVTVTITLTVTVTVTIILILSQERVGTWTGGPTRIMTGRR
jgi:hypothetical protein